MKDYDLAFSLGFSCGVSQALRAAGLQFASYPLDWTGTPDIMAGIRLVVNEFKGWLETEDLDLVDVRHGTGFCTRCYLNRKTQIGFSHEFEDFQPFEETYPRVRQTYDRRVERFMARVRESRRILAVYLETPYRERAAKEDVLSARQILAEKLSHAQVDLLYVMVEHGCSRPKLGELAPGVYSAGYDYRKYDDGEVTHFIDWAPLVPLLHANFHVEDTRSAEAKKGYAKYEKVSGDMRWGPDKGLFRRWLNKHLYKTYRSIESVLINRGLVQKEGPLWFWDK